MLSWASGSPNPNVGGAFTAFGEKYASYPSGGANGSGGPVSLADFLASNGVACVAPSLLQRAGIAIQGAIASKLGKTIGFGAGASASAGFGYGVGVTLGFTADCGLAGAAIDYGAGGGNGWGGGGDFSVGSSNNQTIFQGTATFPFGEKGFGHGLSQSWSSVTPICGG